MRVVVYGFDAIGFDIGGQPIHLGDNVEVEFCPFPNTPRFDQADGVIIPQGIFEKFVDGTSWPASTTVEVYERQLLECDRQLVNLLRDGKWVCFLVDAITDFVPNGYGSRRCHDTDLCKRMLNRFGIGRSLIKETPSSWTKVNEFARYFRNYGVAKTAFDIRWSEYSEGRVLGEVNETTVAFELLSRLFFLPFHSMRHDKNSAKELAETVSMAIVDYRQKRLVELPPWVDDFEFGGEQKLQSELRELLDQSIRRQTELQTWKNYKAVLTTTGEILKGRVIAILAGFFGLRVDPVDESREDARILAEDGTTLVVVGVKGTNTGITKEHIYQVDGHRDRSHLPKRLAGVLIINSDTAVDGIEARLAAEVHPEQVKLARDRNVLIVRTIDLLFLMRHLDRDAARGKTLLNLLQSGGGWLKADSTGYKVITAIAGGVATNIQLP
ncbi:MAG: hypothetical protein ABSA12_11895 [Verrucomicrobiia bacterium]